MTRPRVTAHLSAFLLTVSFCTASVAEVRIADVFSDHMVLQRDKPVPVWGWATAGQRVSVTFAGQTKTASADAKGKWKVRLDPMAMSKEPREMVVTGQGKTHSIKDVLIGDVWLCGGQSNMGRAVNSSWVPKDAKFDYPNVRCMGVNTVGQPYPVDEVEAEWWQCTEENVPNTCAVGFFFARKVQDETGVPIGLIWSAWAGSTVNEWMPQWGWRLEPSLQATADQVDAWYPETEIGRAVWKERLAEIDAWRSKAEAALKAGQPFPFPQPRMPEPPQPQLAHNGQYYTRGTTTLYNGKIHPIAPYALKGILWYQGESDFRNVNWAIQMRAMTTAWRKLFSDGGDGADIPLYLMQIQRSGDYCSPLIRDQQLKALTLVPNAGMAVLLDLDVNVHPANKYDSGERLALWALARDYGKKDLPYSGPLYKSHRIEGNKVIVEFDHVYSRLMIGKKNRLDPVEELPGAELTNVTLAGEDRNWHNGKAKIVGQTLVAWSEAVAQPIALRYCYENIPQEPFLYNHAGLPAAQFRTDDWPR
jgi:sialate O-acetylesterase